MTRTQEMNAEITCLKETAEASSQRMNAVEQRLTGLEQKLGTIETNMIGIMASFAALTTRVQNIAKSLGISIGIPSDLPAVSPLPPPPPDEIENYGVLEEKGTMSDDFEIREFDPNVEVNWENDEAEIWEKKIEDSGAFGHNPYGPAAGSPPLQPPLLPPDPSASAKLGIFEVGKDDSDTEQTESMLGLQSYWDAAYADELSNFREHGHAGEVWFGADVMDIVASWTKGLCVEISQGRMPIQVEKTKSEPDKQDDKYLNGAKNLIWILYKRKCTQSNQVI